MSCSAPVKEEKRSRSKKPNVHVQTERKSSRKNDASAFVKKGKKAERF